MARSCHLRSGRLVWSAAWLIGAAVAGTDAPADELLQAVTTPGRAKLQVCRSWVMYNSCNEYGRVTVPDRITVGDQLFLEFGSNPKSMTFPVARIHFVDGVCTLYTRGAQAEADEAKLDKLIVESCRKQAP
jgi:hypothetical protein